jgi:hypothetical protein
MILEGAIRIRHGGSEESHWIPSSKNLKTSEDSRRLQIAISRDAGQQPSQINTNFKLRSVFRFLQTVKSAEGSGGLCRLKICLQTSSDAPI